MQGINALKMPELYTFKRVNLGEMAEQLRVHAGLIEDLIWFPAPT